MAQGMELDHVDVIDAQPIERPVDVRAGLGRAARAGLGGEEEVLPVTCHPGADAELGVAVPGGRIDVIDAVAEQHLERAVGIRLADLGQRRRAKERHRAPVTGSSEWSLLDHAVSSWRAITRPAARRGASPPRPSVAHARRGPGRWRHWPFR